MSLFQIPIVVISTFDVINITYRIKILYFYKYLTISNNNTGSMKKLQETVLD